MSKRREELLQQAMAYMLANGVANLSLRRLAAALGTSARMLVYHFGSKDDLIIAVVSEVHSRFQASHEKAFARRRAGAEHPLLSFWRTLISPANLGYMRLLFEVQILALQNPGVYARYLDQDYGTWMESIERALRPELKSRTMATLCRAVVDGLLLDVLSTGERGRPTEALVAFLDGLGAPRPPAGTRGRPRTRGR